MNFIFFFKSSPKTFYILYEKNALVIIFIHLFVLNIFIHSQEDINIISHIVILL
jgi:hypothetical protein